MDTHMVAAANPLTPLVTTREVLTNRHILAATHFVPVSGFLIILVLGITINITGGSQDGITRQGVSGHADGVALSAVVQVVVVLASLITDTPATVGFVNRRNFG